MSKKARTSTLLAGFWLLGCGPSAPPAEAPPPSAATQQVPAEPAPSAAPVVAAAPALTAEQIKAEEERARLTADREKARQEASEEERRLTPEIREKAKALANQSYWSLKPALQAAMASEHRNPKSRARDAARHPIETLTFLGVAPDSTVLEYGPGEGWYTELLAPVLYKRGKLLATTTDPAGPAEQRSTYYAERFQWFLNRLPEVYGNITSVVFDPAAPKLKVDKPVDVVLVFRGMHGMVRDGSLGTWLAEFRSVLKVGGVLGVEQHRAYPDADPKLSAEKGYLPEPWLIQQIEAAGFKLKDKSEINANPKDTKDYPKGVWALPPNFALGDQDREKYAAIGESDRMTLRFVKVVESSKVVW